jgi:hypothetical protein
VVFLLTRLICIDTIQISKQRKQQKGKKMYYITEEDKNLLIFINKEIEKINKLEKEAGRKETIKPQLRGCFESYINSNSYRMTAWEAVQEYSKIRIQDMNNI